jgi:ABC-type uncharacterized transport system auxiliary subunit
VRYWLLFLLGASACASLPQTHFYRLTPARTEAAREPMAGVLAIQPLEADSVYSDDQILYRTGPTRVDYYNYHRWISPPAIQLTDYLRDALTRSGLFRRVQSTLDPNADAALAGRVVAFDEVDVSPAEWKGQVDLELELSDARTGAPFWSKRYAVSERIAERSPEGLAVALSAAMQRIVDASAPELANAMRSRPSAETR